ncbi:MAG: C40 family peptidase [Lachnospiraceae bacterium]|nr:C40 family peptidase [Lachnospiraceae bacterium]
MKNEIRYRRTLCLVLSAVLCCPVLSGAAYADGAKKEAAVNYGTLAEEAIDDEAIVEEALNEKNALSADDALFFISEEPVSTEDDQDAITSSRLDAVATAAGVTEEMCHAEYWFSKNTGSGMDIDKPLLTNEELPELNSLIASTEGTNIYDLENMDTAYDADKLRSSLSKSVRTAVKDKDLYLNGVKLEDKAAWFSKLEEKISETGYTGDSVLPKYAVGIHRTLISALPTNDYVGYSATDTDDEKVSSALNVNEPFLIRQKAEIDGEIFYYGFADNCPGWVYSKDLALCKDKEEWLDMWKVDHTKDDFLVVRANQINLEPSLFTPEVSKVKLTFATILKLVPENEIPATVTERGTWNNHVVYLPTRDEDGTLVKRPALISQHYDVSLGYPTLTQKELLKVAFNNLGDRYGWGGMTEDMDCSLYTRNIYRCFGVRLPRNTAWQNAITPRKIDLSLMSDEEKFAAISRMPAGTLLFFPGHITMYTGTTDYLPEGADSTSQNKVAYVISDTGSLFDSVGDDTKKTIYSIIVNPLLVKRANKYTWVRNMQSAILPISSDNMAYVKSLIDEKIEPEKIVFKVPAAEGQTYASSRDNLPLETFLGTTGNIYLSFKNVEGSGVESLEATVIKGSKLTTKSPVKSIICDKAIATFSINKKNQLGSLTVKKSGEVTFEMADGKTYKVYFNAETPKSQATAINKEIAAMKESGSSSATFSVRQLFGTVLDNGTLEIASQTCKDAASQAKAEGNTITLNPGVKNTIKLKYQYLDKKYSMTITAR